MVKMLRLSMKAMKLLAMKQSTTKRPRSATNLQEEQRDGAMKEASTYLVRAHQRQLPRSRVNDTPDLPLEPIYKKEPTAKYVPI